MVRMGGEMSTLVIAPFLRCLWRISLARSILRIVYYPFFRVIITKLTAYLKKQVILGAQAFYGVIGLTEYIRHGHNERIGFGFFHEKGDFFLKQNRYQCCFCKQKDVQFFS